MELRIQRLEKDIELPKPQREGDAAFDLRAAEDVEVLAGKHSLVRTGIKVAIPPGHVGLIWDRGGLAAKNRVTTLGGVVDSNYRGEVQVILSNFGTEPLRIEKGMRIAQFLVQPLLNVNLTEVEELEDTNRGPKGFGSSGLH
jgi:dUTP pyrophosphatase